MKIKIHLAGIALAAGIALTLAGCGSDDTTPSSAKSATSSSAPTQNAAQLLEAKCKKQYTDATARLACEGGDAAAAAQDQKSADDAAAKKKAEDAAKAAQQAKVDALTTSQKQAYTAAKAYLSDGQGFSYQGLIDQLTSSYGNGFSVADATAAVNAIGADYNAQAVLAAKAYLNSGMGFSHTSLVNQLTSAYGSKFTPDQAEYAATQVGL